MTQNQRLLAALLAGGALTTAALAAEPEAKPKWVTSAGLNFTLTEGNSQTLLIGVDINTIKKTKSDEYLLGASGAYGENDSVPNNELARAYGQWNHLFSERFYSYIRAEGLYDGIAGVDYRVTLSPGVGYYFIKNPKTTLSGEVGPGYVFEKLDGVENDYPTLRLAERFERKLSNTARIWQTAEILPDLGDFDKFVANFELGIEAAINTKVSLRSVLTDTYNSQPGGSRKKNDVKIVTGVVYKF
jgi:putative salt-induced outer membrane protein YdiY